MSPSEPVDTSERLVVFTDAVVAIALTLLVLPLVEVVPEARRSGLALGDLLRENLAPLGSFVLSFAVIFRYWWAHHRLFRHVSRLSRGIVAWTVVWVFSIVVLPLPTAVITAYPPSSGTVALYLGTLVLTSGALTGLAVTAHRNPAVSVGRPRETREEVLGMSTAFGAQLVALVVGTACPSPIGYWALLIMVLSGPVERLVKRRWARQERAEATPG